MAGTLEQKRRYRGIDAAGHANNDGHSVSSFHLRRGTAGSARTRSRVQTLENPLGCRAKAAPLHHLPNDPKTAAGGKPLRVGLPPSPRTAAPSGTKRSISAPCSWGRYASIQSRRALAAGTAGLPPARGAECASTRRPKALACRHCRLRRGRRRGLDDDGLLLHAHDLPLAVALHQRDIVPSSLPRRHRGG